MATLLDIKNGVADQLGAGNGTTTVPKRDRAINRARRKFYSERRWSFLRKTATLNFTNKTANLSVDVADYNYKFDPISVYSYTGTTEFKYVKVNWDEVSSYNSGAYVYAINKSLKQIKTNQSTGTLTLEYTYLPTDKSIDTVGNADEEPTSDIEPIILLSIAYWWLSSERATGKYQLFKDEYDKELAKAIVSDSGSQAHKSLRKSSSNSIYGYRGRS